MGRVVDVEPNDGPAADAAGWRAPVRHADAPAAGEVIGTHYSLCFGCGPDHPTGLHLRIIAGEGLAVHAQFDVGEHHQGAPGLAHGGVLTAAFDETMSAVNWLLQKPAVTVHLQVDFRRPVPVGSTLHLTAECTGVRGRRIAIRGTGRLDAPDGPVAVQASSVFVEVPLAHFVEHGRAEDIEAATDRTEVRERTVGLAVNP
jgi:acyl-coenzyme A thioesterase PaaI-like protein